MLCFVLPVVTKSHERKTETKNVGLNLDVRLFYDTNSSNPKEAQ